MDMLDTSTDNPLRPKEVAARLGGSRSMVHKLITDGRFPNAFRNGTEWRIPAADVQNYINSTRFQPVTTSPALSPPSAPAAE